MSSTSFAPNDRVRQGDPVHLEAFLTDPVGCLSDLHARYGPLVVFHKGDHTILFAFGPEYNRLLLTNLDAFSLVGFYPGPRNSAQRRLGNGVFNLNGERHLRHRRTLMPFFQKERVTAYQVPIQRLVDAELAGWKGDQPFDLVRAVKRFTLRLTTRQLFGLPDVDENLILAIDHCFEDWLESNHYESFTSQLPIDMPSHRYERMLAGAVEMERLMRVLVQMRREAPPGHDALALLLQAKEQGAIDENEVVGGTTHLFNAAYHTTSYGLVWTLFLLAQHPDAARSLVEELHACTEAEAIESSTYLDHVIKEGLRMFPPVVYFPRTAQRRFPFGPIALPHGSLVVASHYVTHRLPELYPEPRRFRPERWRTATPGAFGYLPFGAGARMCAGATFATTVMKTFVAATMKRYRLSVVPGASIDRHCTLTLGPRDGIPVIAFRPDGRFSTSPVVGNIHEMLELPTVRAVPAAA